MKESSTKKLRGYCSQCSCWCPTVSYVKDGRFVEVKLDEEHPLAAGVCPKGTAGPELVYNKQRLQYPMRRTKPKSANDPGWERITWDEVLRTIATRLNEIKSIWGAEAIAVGRCGHSGSPMAELDPWLRRLAHAFGTPNSIGTTHICQWHRDNGSSYTFGKPGSRGTAGRPEFERAGSILIWGVNIHANRSSLLPLIKRGLDQGAKLIVVDPRRTEIAAMADVWLQVSPGTDGALALSMINVMIEEKLYDHGFVRDWTTAPFLVRMDTGSFVKGSELTSGVDPSSYVVVDAASNSPKAYISGTILPFEPTVDSEVSLKLANGKAVRCETAFRLLRELSSEYPPDKAEELTGIPAEKIRTAARIIATAKPACWYSWNGIEQNTNATQTNRAICILYALTGDYDKPGGNVILPRLPMNPIDGREFLSHEGDIRRLGFKERPLGPAAILGSVQAYEAYKAILTGKPYPVKALLGFGGNIVMSNPPSILAKEALLKLEFHVQAELFMTPTAELADIVLPAASFWESWHVGTNISSLGEKAHVQLRPAVVPPQHESRPDMEIMFELANRLGLGDKFWDGDIEAAFNYQFAPADITVQQLRQSPGGVSINLPMEYQKYRKKDSDDKFVGLPSPSKRVEIYSQIFKDHGYEPLPAWQEPRVFRSLATNLTRTYPLILTGAKVAQYCHSEHRALPSLRKIVPHPFLEINPKKAEEIGCEDEEWVKLESPYGAITVKIKLSERVPYDVVCTQNGWWQGCPELNLPSYDPYSPDGANVNLLFMTDLIDPISGSLPLKVYPCNVRRKG